jgi:rhamnogalacturonyl hydrolase YesR
MERYFDESRSIAGFAGGKIEIVLEVIANRYIAANPRCDYTGRPFTTHGIIRNKNYRYETAFEKIFPHVPDGAYVYVWGKYRAEDDGSLKFTLIPKGPAKIWMNSEMIYATTVEMERYAGAGININLPVHKGWNHLVLRFTSTKAGFGGEFGTWLGKLDYYFFRGLSPHGIPEIEGFDYTAPMETPLADPAPEFLAPFCLPLPQWSAKEKATGCFGRIFGHRTGTSASGTGGSSAAVTEHVVAADSRVIARTLIYTPVRARYTFSIVHTGNCSLWAGAVQVFAAASGAANTINGTGSDSRSAEYMLEAGFNQIAVISEYPAAGAAINTTGAVWGFTLNVEAAAPALSPVRFINPFFPEQSGFGTTAAAAGKAAQEFSWVYAGPFRNTTDAELLNFDREQPVGGEGEKTWWRLDMPGGWVRLYNENPLYGHWNYPLGVTLYGLIETARHFEKKGKNSIIGGYVRDHAAKSVRTLDYALFDKEHFGGATAVHHLLTSIDSLDDCGSFGSFIQEAAKDRDIGDFRRAADYVGEHILYKQDRLPDGTFYRRQQMHHFHNGTLWADDLYMSVPFLCHYSSLKGDASILNDAANQFEGFKQHLFMEDIKLMAHVYDFKRDMNTGIPWGRGNGWTIFSLTELLLVLPKDHPKRNFLLNFFRTLAAGYLSCQDADGMWHQVLNMPSSYQETSCTAMFICAFSRGIRQGWFEDNTSPGARPAGSLLQYCIAADKAWKALERNSIDRDGNVYGVCRGSEFAFNPRYYAEHLLPRLNDTHGIGIVLLAGVELLKLREYLANFQGEL